MSTQEAKQMEAQRIFTGHTAVVEVQCNDIT